MRDSFGAAYDAWLTTDRSLDRHDTEWEAYETWCEENGHEMLDKPGDDGDWQLYCAEQNRLEDESWATYMEAEADE
jgi:hypothetical protein